MQEKSNIIKEYEEFVSHSPFGYFTQSSSWAEVKSSWTHEFVISKDNDGKTNGAMLLLIKKIKGLKYTFAYSPRGPVCDLMNKEILSQLFKKAFEICKKYNAYQLKIDPAFSQCEKEKIDVLKSFGFQFIPDKPDFSTVQIRNNYVIKNLENMTEEQLLASFKQKTRYNIKVAKKHNVECRVFNGKETTEKAFEDFYHLYKITAARDKFTIRGLDYYKKILTEMDEHAKIYICYYNEHAVSAALCINYSNRTYYLFGASDNEYRFVMPNYLMQWEMMRYALEKKSSTYDFMGIPLTDDENAIMAGVLRFKKGFCGETETFPGEFDYNFKPFVLKTINCLLKIKKML